MLRPSYIVLSTRVMPISRYLQCSLTLELASCGRGRTSWYFIFDFKIITVNYLTYYNILGSRSAALLRLILTV